MAVVNQPTHVMPARRRDLRRLLITMAAVVTAFAIGTAVGNVIGDRTEDVERSATVEVWVPDEAMSGLSLRDEVETGFRWAGVSGGTLEEHQATIDQLTAVQRAAAAGLTGYAETYGYLDTFSPELARAVIQTESFIVADELSPAFSPELARAVAQQVAPLTAAQRAAAAGLTGYAETYGYLDTFSPDLARAVAQQVASLTAAQKAAADRLAGQAEQFIVADEFSPEFIWAERGAGDMADTFSPELIWAERGTGDTADTFSPEMIWAERVGVDQGNPVVERPHGMR